MLRHLGILATIYVGLVAHCSLVPMAPIGMGQPFLPALILVVIVAGCDSALSILWCGLLGLMLDGLSTERLGLQLGLAALLGLGLQLLQSFWRSRSFVALVSTTMLVCIAWRILSPMTQAVLASRIVDPHPVLVDAAQDAAWTAVLACVLLAPRGLLGQRERVGMMVANPGSRWGAVHR